MEELQSEQKKVLIFSQFVSFLKILRHELQERNWKFCYLDGSTSFSKRQEEIETFQKDQAIPFFLLSLKSGGTGLNLSCATEVIHLDPWWDPAIEDQASDRVHRIGQTQPVTIIRMISRNTIEEKIVQLHQKNRLLAENILSDQNSVSLEDLHSLLED
jgi:SNF2 family DNA or RNA helicase